jgi:hypothetical protein
MAEGQGNITYGTTKGAGGGGGGIVVNGAKNGLSVAGGYIVLGNDAGDATIPAALINNRDIPMGGFYLNMYPGGLETNYFRIDSSALGMLNYYKGLSGQEPATLITIQGASPGSNPYGNFHLTLDESFTNPDGQIDAVMQCGYNQNGVGGPVLPGEAAIHWAMESHFQQSGGKQFEIHLQSYAQDATITRHFSLEVQKANGGAEGFWTAAQWSWFDQTGLEYWSIVNTGQATLAGPGAQFTVENTAATSGQLRIDTNNDGSTNINNTSTGSNPIVVFQNDLTIDMNSGAFAGLTVNLLNTGNVQGAIVLGAVTGNAFPYLAVVNATAGVLNLLENTGPGLAADVITVKTAGTADAYTVYQESSFTNVFSAGFNQSSNQYRIAFANGLGTGNILSMTSTAQVGAGGNTAPTAFFHIAASPGTAGQGPWKLTPGPLLPVPEDGLIEYDGTNFYKTIGVTRTIIL